LRYVLPLVCLLAAPPAYAQAVDAAGADQITANLSRYLGSTVFEKGVVKVAVDGDAYKLEVDFDQLLSLFSAEDTLKLDFDPYVLRLKPRPDATWDVTGDMAPNGSWEATSEQGPVTGAITIADDSFSGIYDPSMAYFPVANGKFGAFSMTSSSPDQSSDSAFASGSFELQSTKNSASGVDFTARYSMQGFTQTNRTTVPEPGMDLPMVIRSPEVSYDSSGTGLRTKPILDLLAFAVANGEEAKLKAAEPQLKTLLREALPLWEHLTGAYKWRELSVGTPMGIFGAANAGIEVAMDGVRKDGTIAYRFLVDDLTMPADVLPKWTLPLLPEDIDLNFGGSGVDLEGPATMAIDAIDLEKDPPIAEEVGDSIVAQFMASPPKFLINRSIVRNKDTEISAEGEVTFAGGKPAVTATVEAAGFDKAMETIQQAMAAAPEAQQVYLVAVAAQGFAKTLSDGRLQWAIEMTPDGAVTVNGAMVKPADPTAAPSPQ
jgi:hypothetical protein